MVNIDIDKLLKRKETKIHSITNSYNIKKIFQEIRRNKFNGKQKVDESTFYSIIKEVNLEIADTLLKESIIDFPMKLGTIYLTKYKTKTYFKNGRLVSTKPIDWKATYTLWQEDEECYKNKTLVRLDKSALTKAIFSHKHKIFKNSQFMTFKLKRDLRIKLNKLLHEGKLEVYK